MRSPSDLAAFSRNRAPFYAPFRYPPWHVNLPFAAMVRTSTPHDHDARQGSPSHREKERSNVVREADGFFREALFTVTRSGATGDPVNFLYETSHGTADDSDYMATAALAGQGSSVSVDHVFAAAGMHAVSVTAIDKDGGRGDAAAMNVNITPTLLAGGVLYVGGSGGDDTITVELDAVIPGEAHSSAVA